MGGPGVGPGAVPAPGRPARRGRRATVRESEAGTVSAEAATVLPTLLAFTVGMTWLVSLGVTHVRAVDAAREAARSVARGESPAQGAALARRVAGAGSSTRIGGDADVVVVTVRATVDGPGGIFGFVRPMSVDARAVAAREPGQESAP